MIKRTDKPYIPKDLPIEQLRKWLAAKLEKLDQTKRDIRQLMKERQGNPDSGKDWFIRAKDKIKFLNKERQFYKNRLGEVKREIKQRNIEKHTLETAGIEGSFGSTVKKNFRINVIHYSFTS